MPTENRSYVEMISVPERLLNVLKAPYATFAQLRDARHEMHDFLTSQPAEQHQGGPVARVEVGADRNACVTITDSNWLRGLKDKGIHQVVPLYPAPAVQKDEPDFKSDENALYIFSKLMAHKLAKNSAEGRSGWQECSQEDLTRMLREHVEKGDPVDVASFCMMLCANGMRIGPADAGEVERLRAALKFYADREHYHFESGNWDTVSGEPLNILWCGDDPDFIEDGSVARAALERKS